ncbi:amino acid permease-domain-containing protein [Radiomyces spectabilis]|uniref:amino acid permease-domain-containing protein n=1 Tax=Radiomyces spectabilis TaxID=64574 RepID=UPI0022202AE3|nr:amino acid permease-domain-containing protein [Radiomyces spectabilis]KAI8384318.1 amino acid permease-domain-containing protein [Radiomyces spectabilis]
MSPSSSYHYEHLQSRELESAFELDDAYNSALDHDPPGSLPDEDDDAASLLSDHHDQQTLLPSTHHANSSSTSVFSFDVIPMIPLTQTQARAPELQKKVSFFNGLSLVIGAMIGSGLFSSPGPVLEATHSAPGTALVIWFISGLLALSGALCYAELGTMLPMNGGEAVYLNRAFGSLVSFMFEFVSIVVQKPGSIAIVCIVFGEYVSRIAYHTYFFKIPHDTDASVELADAVIPGFLPKLLAIVSLLILSVINAFSIRAGIRVQDVLTVLKVLTATVISVIGFVILAKGPIAGNSFQVEAPFADIDVMTYGQYALAFYSGLWAYDGWNNLNYVAGEMNNPHRDLPRVIMFGIPTVILAYLLANVAYLAVLRPEVIMHTNTVAMDFGKKLFGPTGGILFAVCVALSCFGTANASVFTGARIIYVSAKQGHLPGFFGKLNTSRQTPLTAILLQAGLTTLLILVGSFRGLVNFYSLCAWFFYFLAVLSLLILRYKEPDLKRPYRVWLSTPVLFCVVALFLCTTPFIEAPFESLAALGFVLLAIPIWLIHVKYRQAIANFWHDIVRRFQRRSKEYQNMEMVYT